MPGDGAERGAEGRGDDVVGGRGRGGGGGELEGADEVGGHLRHRAIDVDSEVAAVPGMVRGDGQGDDEGDVLHPTHQRGMLHSAGGAQSSGGCVEKLEVEMGGPPATRTEIESWIWIVRLTLPIRSPSYSQLSFRAPPASTPALPCLALHLHPHPPSPLLPSSSSPTPLPHDPSRFTAQDWANSCYSSVAMSGFLPILVQTLCMQKSGFPIACPNVISDDPSRVRAAFPSHVFADGEAPVMFSVPSFDATSCINTGPDPQCSGRFCRGLPTVVSQCFEADGATPFMLSVDGG